MMTSHVQIIMPSHVNGAGRLFGGQLMAWIDVTAAVEARRHCRKHVITATVDNLEFLAPVNVDETVRLDACVTRTWSTSLEVRVDSFVEALDGRENLVNRAYLVFVALDDNGKPAPVPRFEPETPEEKHEWEAAAARREIRLAARKRHS